MRRPFDADPRERGISRDLQGLTMKVGGRPAAVEGSNGVWDAALRRPRACSGLIFCRRVALHAVAARQGTRREINREIQAVRCSIGRPRPVAASIGREVKSIRREETKISNDLQADAASMNPDSSRLRCHIPFLRYVGGTGAIAQNPFRGNIYPFRYHLTPAGVKTQGHATCCRTLPGKSLQRKDLRPDRSEEHTSELQS